MSIFFLFSFAFHFSSFWAICKASSDNHFAFLHFFFLDMVLVTASCTILWTSICSSLGTLSDLIPWIYLSLLLCNHKRIDLGHTWKAKWFSLLQFKSEFCNKEFMIWAAVSSRSCFCWLYRASPSSAAKNIINLTLVLTIWWCPCVESFLVLLEEGVFYDTCILLQILLAFDLLHFVLQGQTCLLLLHRVLIIFRFLTLALSQNAGDSSYSFKKPQWIFLPSIQLQALWVHLLSHVRGFVTPWTVAC